MTTKLVRRLPFVRSFFSSSSRRPSAILSALVLACTGLHATAARALQPLEVFVSGARSHHPQNRESIAHRSRAEAQADEALARALPGVAASAAYTRNQWDVRFGGLAVLPRDQREAAVTVSVPLVDLAKFARISSANRAAEASVHQQAAVAREVEAHVVQLYYQLAANLALVEVARRAVDVVRVDLKLTEEAARAGSAAALDVSRAQAEVEQRSQQLTSAELGVSLLAQALSSRSGVRPDISAPPELADDLHAEPAVEEFLSGVPATPSVLSASAAHRAAERNVTAQRLTLLPALNGAFVERYTNATGFLNGHRTAYAATLSLTWALDLGTAAAIRARKAEAAAALARRDAATLEVTDLVVQAFRTIQSGIARSRSARAQAAATARAADIARTRYRAGVVTQLEMIQAERDAFAAEAARIQADSDLLNARRQLRLAAGRAADYQRE